MQGISGILPPRCRLEVVRAGIFKDFSLFSLEVKKPFLLGCAANFIILNRKILKKKMEEEVSWPAVFESAVRLLI